MSFAMIPAELKERDQWVVWRLEDREGKPTKVPYRGYHTVAKASSVDPGTWTSFERAVAAAEEEGIGGIGYVFATDDPFVGIDLDSLDAEAAAIILALDSYTEHSISGRGAHVIVRGHLNGHPRNRKGPLEVYDAGRYFIVTGDHLTGTPLTIEQRQSELERVLAQFLPAQEGRGQALALSPGPVPLDDRELIDKASSARNGADFKTLYEGGVGGLVSIPQ